MKCICGYEEKSKDGKYINDIFFRMIIEVAFENKFGAFNGSQEIFACPKCGTLKIESKE
jgi:hypothetical protein